jgi:hypothetical protein
MPKNANYLPGTLRRVAFLRALLGHQKGIALS